MKDYLTILFTIIVFINIWNWATNSEYAFHGLTAGTTSVSSSVNGGSSPDWNFPGKE